MARVSTYLNFERDTEQAFEFYKNVFKKDDFDTPLQRMADVPPQEGQPDLSEDDKNLIMHIQLSILGGHVLHGTDAPESMGFKLIKGNNVYINLEPDTRTEADVLFADLAFGGKVEMEMQEMFWGDYFGSLTDQFGLHWMINCSAKE